MTKKISIELTVQQWGDIIDALFLDADIRDQDARDAHDESDAEGYRIASSESLALARLIQDVITP